MLQETYAPGMSVSRRRGIAPNQLFRWRRLYAEGALSAAGAGEEVVPASEFTDVVDPIGPSGYLDQPVRRNDPVLINLHTELSYLRATYSR